jgi:hypothetical protein
MNRNVELNFKTNKADAEKISFEQVNDYKGAQLISGLYLKPN